MAGPARTSAKGAGKPAGGKAKAKPAAPARKAATPQAGQVPQAAPGLQSGPQGVPRAPCACGGDCPRCAARPDRPPPRAVPSKPAPRPRDAAEAEAHRLAPRLRLIGAPSAPVSQAGCQTGGQAGAKSGGQAGFGPSAPTGASSAPAAPRLARADPAPNTAPRARIRQTATPDPRLTRHRRLTRRERQGAEAALGLDLEPVRLYSGPVAHALAAAEGALAYTHGNHIVLGAAAATASQPALDRLLAHELIHVVQQTCPPVRAPPVQAPPLQAPTILTLQHAGPGIRGPPPQAPVQPLVQPLIRTAPQVQRASVRDELMGFASGVADSVVDLGTGAVDLGGDLVDGAVELAGDAADLGVDALKRVVDFLAPGVWDFLTGGAIEQLADMLCSGLDLLLGTLFDGLKDIDIMSTLEETFSGLARDVTAAQASLAARISGAVGSVLAPVVDALSEWGMPVVKTIQSMADGAGSVMGSVWDNVAVPVLTFLEAAGGWVWKGFTDLIAWVWSAIAPLRSAAGRLWQRITDHFELVWDSTADIRADLADWASGLLDDMLEAVEPIKTPLMVVGALFVLFSPLGPVIILTQVLPPLYDKLKWLAENWDKTDVVVAFRQILHDDILPGIIGLVDGAKAALGAAASWLAGMLGSLAKGMLRVVAAFGSVACLQNVAEIIANIDDQVARFQAWAEGGFAGLNAAVSAMFGALKAIFQPILDFIVKLLVVAANPPMLPIALTALVWLYLPAPLKPPVIDFVLALLIAFISAMPTFLPGLFPLAAVFKAGVLGFLRRMQSDEVGEAARVAAANKMAHLASGGGVAFIAGYAVGILRGLIDGIIDPFKLLFMLFDLIMKGIAVVGRVMGTLIAMASPAAAQGIGRLNAAISGPAVPAPAANTDAAPAAAAPAAASAPEATGAIAARAPPAPGRKMAIISRLTAPGQPGPSGAPAPAANTNAPPAANTNAPPAPSPAPSPAPRRTITRVSGGAAAAPVAAMPPIAAGAQTRPAHASITARQPAAGPGPVVAAVPDAAPAVAAAEAAPAAEADPDAALLTTEVSDAAILAHLPQAAAMGAPAASTDAAFTPESLEADMRGEVGSQGASVGGLARLLGDAWSALMAGAGRVGAMAADWLMQFLAKPDYELGNSLGWLTGMILLELLIAYFTAGGYMVIKEGASFGTRLLAYFVRYLDMGGAILGVMGKGLARLRGPIMGGFEVAAGFLSRFRFLDGILGRVRGAAEWLFRFGDEIGLAADIARRGPLDGGAARGAAGLADEGAEAALRGADDVLPGPALGRTADAPPAGAARPTRAADDALPATPARGADDAVPSGPPGRGTDAPAPLGAVDEATDLAADRAAREAMEGAGSRPPRQGLDEAADGSRRTIDDAAHPTMADDAARATQFPQAVIAARQIAETNDLIDTPVPVVLGQLLFLKRRYRWISHFTARPSGPPGTFKLGMVASPETEVDGRYTVHADAEGTTMRPLGPDPEVITVPPGSRPGRMPEPRPAPADLAPPGRRVPFEGDDLGAHFDDVVHGPAGTRPDHPFPSRPSRTEVHTGQVTRFEDNRIFGNVNEDLLTRQLDDGVGAVGQRFDNVAEQVYIRPIVDPNATGAARYADYRVRADNLARDRATGGLHVLDAKTTPGASLTPNQEAGYPLIAAHGGRIESRGLPNGLGHHTELGPTPVSRAIPQSNLRRDPLPAGGRPEYDLVPVAPADGHGGPMRVSVTPAPHPAIPAPHPATPTPSRPPPAGPAPRPHAEPDLPTGAARQAGDAPPGLMRTEPSIPEGNGAFRGGSDPAFPTQRNAAEKTLQLPEALGLARGVVLAADRINLPIPLVLGELMLLKRRYRWIDHFRADPTGPTSFRITLIASSIPVGSITTDPLVLFHGTTAHNARRLGAAMRDSTDGFVSADGMHDIGRGLYLFQDARGAAHYAGEGGTIIRIEIPAPHPDDIADISLQGFGRGGAPGAERGLFLREGGQAHTPLADNLDNPALMFPGLPPEILASMPPMTPANFGKLRELAKAYTTEMTTNAASPFSRNLARAQLFHGTVPPHARLAPGGLAFEYDIVQWRMRAPSDDVRRQIIAAVFGGA